MTPTGLDADSVAILPRLRTFIEGDRVVKASTLADIENHLQELKIDYHDDLGILWAFMDPSGQPCFTPRMIYDFLALFEGLKSLPSEVSDPYRVLVYGSNVPGVFNRGGDLPLFLDCIAKRDAETLRTYAHGCALMSYQNRNFSFLPLVTVALLQGDALGGGFEAALSCDILIAERSAMFGFPESLFNLFPGMGAITYLVRRIGRRAAERLIVEGGHFSAQQMLDLGAIDEVVEDGCGVQAVRSLVSRRRTRYSAWSGFHRGHRLAEPVSYEELRGISDIWVERAMLLKPHMQRRMTQLIRMQVANHELAVA